MQQIQLRKFNKGIKRSDAFHLAPSVSLYALSWWVFCALLLARDSEGNKSKRVSQSVLGTHSSTAAVQLTMMLLALFPSWTTEHIHKGSLGSKLKLSSFSMKEIYHFSNPTSSEHCFRKSISAANELMKKEKVKSVLPPYLGCSLSMWITFKCIFPSLQRRVEKDGLLSYFYVYISVNITLKSKMNLRQVSVPKQKYAPFVLWVWHAASTTPAALHLLRISHVQLTLQLRWHCGASFSSFFFFSFIWGLHHQIFLSERFSNVQSCTAKTTPLSFANNTFCWHVMPQIRHHLHVSSEWIPKCAANPFSLSCLLSVVPLLGTSSHLNLKDSSNCRRAPDATIILFWCWTGSTLSVELQG